MRTKSRISGYIIRSAAWAAFFSFAIVALTSALNLSDKWLKPVVPVCYADKARRASNQSRTLRFQVRVAYQRAIEEVYWRHRNWPKERPDPKPSLDEVMSQEQLEEKVEDYLRKSQALEDHWQRPITVEQLQAEMDRMAKHSKQPEVLRELFEALGNDPVVIAECLARPTLAERSLMNWHAYEQRVPKELTQRAEADLLTDPMVLAQEEERLQSFPAEVQNEPANAIAAASDEYILPDVPDVGECTGDTWTATSTINAPSGRILHTAVWTGSEMIVWGGNYEDSIGDYHYLNTGGRYNPATDSWTATSTTNAPDARTAHTAVWTGTEMIAWGGIAGGSYFNTGGRYNPSTDSWTATSTTNAPAARWSPTAVWTGSQMIVWGGEGIGGYLKTGGRYNPTTNSWTATSTTNPPSARISHTARWTGSEMIVWGGYDYPDDNPLNTGGRYNPSTDTWTPTSTTNAPTGRGEHTAVWTGNEMIIWGGYDSNDFTVLNTGGKYNPSTDTWTRTSIINAPAARSDHTAVWTGSEMIVWGGFLLNSGGRYNPVSDSWTATSTTNAPTARDLQRGVWTGNEMIIWGGYDGSNINYFNTGGRYCALGPPIVTTNPATFIASFSATLNASLNPHGLATTFHLQYGRTTAYGLTTAPQTLTGNTSRHVTANISSLTANTAYHFRLVASNVDGTRMGADRVFTTLTMTGQPVVITDPTSSVTAASATLHGSLDPHGLTSTVHFQFGTTPSYGHATAMQTQTGNTYRNISANISGLMASHVYHFRIVATNSAGTRYGTDRTFITP